MSRPVAIVIAVAALVGACAKKIDTGDAEAKIKAWATENVANATAVSCANAEMKKGATFVCKVTFDTAGPFDLNVDQKDDSGNVEWKWAKPLGGGAKFEAMVVRVIKDKTGNDATAKCPAEIQVLPDDGLPCTVTFAGQDATMLVKMDADGNVDIEPKK
jgi:hypothetical protein